MILDPILDLFRGKAVTIPPLDGAFRPNTLLDEAPEFATLSEPDSLVVRDGSLLAASGNAVFALGKGEPALVERFDAKVSAMAVSPAGVLTVALETGRIIEACKDITPPTPLRCITALAYGTDGALWIANGSDRHGPSEWTADLMHKGASGSVWRRDPATGTFARVADGLAWPAGLLPAGDGVLVSEAWNHRLLRITAGGSTSVHAAHLPGYPARLSPAAGGGAWLAISAPRNRLIEFVLQEDDYRADMMAEVPAPYWIAPALSSNRSFLEPLQCGAIRSMGVHKPWSPTRSYGLVVRLDAALMPVSSLHSRANGTRHGICSAVEHGGVLYAAARGGDCVVEIDIGSAEAA